MHLKTMLSNAALNKCDFFKLLGHFCISRALNLNCILYWKVHIIWAGIPNIDILEFHVKDKFYNYNFYTIPLHDTVSANCLVDLVAAIFDSESFIK